MALADRSRQTAVARRAGGGAVSLEVPKPILARLQQFDRGESPPESRRRRRLGLHAALTSQHRSHGGELVGRQGIKRVTSRHHSITSSSGSARNLENCGRPRRAVSANPSHAWRRSAVGSYSRRECRSNTITARSSAVYRGPSLAGHAGTAERSPPALHVVADPACRTPVRDSGHQRTRTGPVDVEDGEQFGARGWRRARTSGRCAARSRSGTRRSGAWPPWATAICHAAVPKAKSPPSRMHALGTRIARDMPW